MHIKKEILVSHCFLFVKRIFRKGMTLGGSPNKGNRKIHLGTKHTDYSNIMNYQCFFR